MKAEIHFTLKEEQAQEEETKEMQHSAEKIWNAITKYISKHVTIDKDGIFKDPNWPHLWDTR